MIALPPFPWDRLAGFAEQAADHPDGAVDLSIGTPVDPVPAVVRRALTDDADFPGYPMTAGTVALRDAAADWVRRQSRVSAVFEVLPTIGSKELVAALPTQLGLGPADTVVIPELGYPTYEVGVLLAGATVVRADDPTALPGPPPAMVWLNHPANPTGRVLSAQRLREIVTWARRHGVVVVSDECYLTLGWEAQPVSILDEAVCGGDATGVLAVHSLSKRSNLAGYRAGFIAGDPSLVSALLALRKHAGLIVPRPVQSAMVAALRDEEHATEQRRTYRRRREVLRAGLVEAGFTIDESVAGLYLWATRGEDCWDTVAWLAERGIVVSAGEFYGPKGSHHVRVGLTAPDDRIAAAVARLRAG